MSSLNWHSLVTLPEIQFSNVFPAKRRRRLQFSLAPRHTTAPRADFRRPFDHLGQNRSLSVCLHSNWRLSRTLLSIPFCQLAELHEPSPRLQFHRHRRSRRPNSCPLPENPLVLHGRDVGPGIARRMAKHALEICTQDPVRESCSGQFWNMYGFDSLPIYCAMGGS